MTDPREFRFVPVDEEAYAAADLDATLALALADTAEGVTFEDQVRMLTGLARRADLKPSHVKKITENLHDRATLLAALLNNPAVQNNAKSDALARAWIGGNLIPTLLTDLEDPARYLSEILVGACIPNSMFTDLRARVSTAFTPAQIEEAIDSIVADHIGLLRHGRKGRTPIDEVGRLAWLTPTHIDDLIDTLEEVQPRLDSDLGPDTWAITRTAEDLGARTDLTESQAHRLFDLIAARAEKEAAQGWTVGHNVTRFLSNQTLPESLFVRALVNPHTVLAVLDSARHSGQVRLMPEVMVKALAQGADLRIARKLYGVNFPVPMLSLILDRLDTGDGADLDGALRAEILANLVNGATDHIGTPVWDRIYALFCDGRVLPAAATEDTGDTEGAPVDDETAAIDAFATVVESRNINFADTSRRPVLQNFAVWASASDDARLRKHAIKHCYSAAQVDDAALDPAWQVREEVARHPLASSDLTNALASDPHPAVRRVIATHEKAHVETVRLLANDTDEQVRNLVAERFMNAFTA